MNCIHPRPGPAILLTAAALLLSLFPAPAATQAAGLLRGAQIGGNADSAGRILYVRSGSAGDCSSWSNACGLQTALTIAAPGDQVWVQAGIYKPDEVDFASCQDIRIADSSADDGAYYIQTGGTAVRVHCADMAGTPKEYLELKNPETNFSQYTAGGSSPGTNVITKYDRIRFLPETLTVDISDQTFATSVGELNHSEGGTKITSMPYSVAADCLAPGSQAGVGKIDLSNTIFAVHSSETFVPGGHLSNGEVVFSDNRQVVDLKGGGNCGWITPAPPVFDPFNNSGGPILELEQIQLDRSVSFQLKSGVAVYGGFAGTETALAQRDWAAHPTILSGDIDDNDPTVDGVVTDPAQIDGENAYHVVDARSVDATAILDGFTLTAGKADGDSFPDTFGGGMFIMYGSPIVRNVILTGNRAHSGGGMGSYGMMERVSRSTLDHVIVSHNMADSAGGGIYNVWSMPTFTNVTLLENSADHAGGMYNQFGQSTLSNVAFVANTAVSDAGGMQNWDNDSILTNVTFSGNTAGNNTGGMSLTNSDPILTNVTFTGNSAEGTAGVIEMIRSTLTLTNAIVWGNTPTVNPIVSDENRSVFIRYSIIQDGWKVIFDDGEGFFSANPRLGPLADNGGGTLTHALNEWSLAIDMGDPTNCPEVDQRGVPRPLDGDGDGEARCDLGAYEYRPPSEVFLPLVMK